MADARPFVFAPQQDSATEQTSLFSSSSFCGRIDPHIASGMRQSSDFLSQGDGLPPNVDHSTGWSWIPESQHSQQQHTMFVDVGGRPPSHFDVNFSHFGRLDQIDSTKYAPHSVSLSGHPTSSGSSSGLSSALNFSTARRIYGLSPYLRRTSLSVSTRSSSSPHRGPLLT